MSPGVVEDGHCQFSADRTLNLQMCQFLVEGLTKKKKAANSSSETENSAPPGSGFLGSPGMAWAVDQIHRFDGVSINGGTQKWWVDNAKSQSKMDDLGVAPISGNPHNGALNNHELETKTSGSLGKNKQTLQPTLSRSQTLVEKLMTCRRG